MSGDADPCDSKGNSPLQSSLALDGVQDFKGKALFDLGKIVFWIFLITAIWSRWQIALQDWLWIDELHTSWVVSGELRQVIPRAAAGNQSSPYFFLVFAVIQWLGQSPLTLRLVSALSGLLTFALASQWVAQKTGSIWAAIGALIFLGFDSTMVFCGTDARPYAVLQLLAVVSAIRLFRFLESTNRPVVAWDLVILCGLMVAIHPVGILFVSGIVLVLAVPLVKLPSRGGEPIGEVRWASKNKLLTPLMVVFGCIGGLALNPALGSILDRRSQWANITDWKQLLFDCVCLMLCAWILPSILISLSTRSESRLNASAQTTLERVFRKPSRLLLVLFVVPVMITLGLEFT